jgi:hypothetical protein
MPLIAAAIIGGSLYQANEARRARKGAEEQQTRALMQQQRDAAAMREELARQTLEYSKQYGENKAAMEAKAKEVQAAAEEERRKAAESEASALKARTRGGRRSLLSQERMNSELGIGSTTLGSGMMVQ